MWLVTAKSHTLFNRYMSLITQDVQNQVIIDIQERKLLQRNLNAYSFLPVSTYRSGWWWPKKSLFFLDGVNAQLAVFLGVLLRDNMLMVAFRSSRCNIVYNRLATGLSVMFMFHFGKGVTVFNFLRFLSSCLFSWLAFNPQFRLAGIEDTFWTLIAIPFKVGLNNS